MQSKEIFAKNTNLFGIILSCGRPHQTESPIPSEFSTLLKCPAFEVALPYPVANRKWRWRDTYIMYNTAPRGLNNIRAEISPRDFQISPRDFQISPRDFRKSPRDFSKSPRDFSALPSRPLCHLSRDEEGVQPNMRNPVEILNPHGMLESLWHGRRAGYPDAAVSPTSAPR